MINPKHVDIVFDIARESAETGELTLVVAGDCMRPALANGDAIRVGRAKHYLPGDVVAFRTDKTLVVHRVLGWAPEAGGGLGVVTRGDHCTRHDGVVPLSRMLGRVAVPVGLCDRVKALLAFASIVVRKVLGTA